MLDGGGGGAERFIRLMEEAVALAVVRLGGSLAGEESGERLVESFLNILKSKNI